MTALTTAAWWMVAAGGGGSTAAPAPAFHRDGPVFRTDDGAIFPWAFGSEFPLLRWTLDGRDIRPLLAERYAVGQRGCSFFLTSEIEDARLGDGGPYADQAILDALGPFVDMLRAHGMNSEACVFQAVSVTMPQRDRQQKFWNAVLDIAKGRPWMSVSVSKEWWKQLGALDFDHLRRPGGHTWDGGGIPDGGSQGLNVAPGIWVAPLRGSHDTFQASRTDEWPRKTKSAWEIAMATGLGCVTGEPMGADETNQPGRRSNVPDDFFWSAATARLMSLGSYFHPQAGIRGTLYGPVQRTCALAHFEALSLIPCAAQLGAYAKSIGAAVVSYDDQPGGSLRTYGMQTHVWEQWCVVIRPGPSYPRNGALIDPAVAPGWMIRDRLGPMGTVLRVTR